MTPPIRLVLLVVLVSAAAHSFALSPVLAGTSWMWLTLLGAYLLLGALALYRFWDDGTLLDKLLPRGGDASVGILGAGALVGGAWLVMRNLSGASPIPHPWLLRLFLQIGSSTEVRTSALAVSTVLLVAALEEIVWRGLVLDALAETVGTRWAWPLAALAYALAVAPTLWTLSDDLAGLNPLLLLAALGLGLVTSYFVARTGRLVPTIIGHAVFTFAVTALPLLRPPGL